jgi:hypothetical protein
VTELIFVLFEFISVGFDVLTAVLMTRGPSSGNNALWFLDKTARFGVTFRLQLQLPLFVLAYLLFRT